MKDGDDSLKDSVDHTLPRADFWEKVSLIDSNRTKDYDNIRLVLIIISAMFRVLVFLDFFWVYYLLIQRAASTIEFNPTCMLRTSSYPVSFDMNKWVLLIYRSIRCHERPHLHMIHRLQMAHGPWLTAHGWWRLASLQGPWARQTQACGTPSLWSQEPWAMKHEPLIISNLLFILLMKILIFYKNESFPNVIIKLRATNVKPTLN